MSKAKKAEIKEKSLEALREDLKNKRSELFKAQLEHARRKLTNTTSLTHMRKDIARMLTMIKLLHAQTKLTAVSSVAKTKADKKEVANG